jgi:hypothetical protein
MKSTFINDHSIAAGSGSLPSDWRSQNIHNQFPQQMICYSSVSNSHKDYDNDKSDDGPGFQFCFS